MIELVVALLVGGQKELLVAFEGLLPFSDSFPGEDEAIEQVSTMSS